MVKRLTSHVVKFIYYWTGAWEGDKSAQQRTAESMESQEQAYVSRRALDLRMMVLARYWCTP